MPPLGGNIPGGRRAQFFPGITPQGLGEVRRWSSIQEEGIHRQRHCGLKSSWRWNTCRMVDLWSPVRYELDHNFTCHATPLVTVKTKPAHKHGGCGLTRGSHSRMVWRAVNFNLSYLATWPSPHPLVKKFLLQSVSISHRDKCQYRWFCFVCDCWLVTFCLFICLNQFNTS